MQGTVKDPTGAVMVAVVVNISNAVSGYRRTATTDAQGKFAFQNLPPNGYHVEVTAQGFQTLTRDLDVRSSVPIDVDLALSLAGQTTSVEVVGRLRPGHNKRAGPTVTHGYSFTAIVPLACSSANSTPTISFRASPSATGSYPRTTAPSA